MSLLSALSVRHGPPVAPAPAPLPSSNPVPAAPNDEAPNAPRAATAPTSLAARLLTYGVYPPSTPAPAVWNSSHASRPARRRRDAAEQPVDLSHSYNLKAWSLDELRSRLRTIDFNLAQLPWYMKFPGRRSQECLDLDEERPKVEQKIAAAERELEAVRARHQRNDTLPTGAPTDWRRTQWLDTTASVGTSPRAHVDSYFSRLKLDSGVAVLMEAAKALAEACWRLEQLAAKLTTTQAQLDAAIAAVDDAQSDLPYNQKFAGFRSEACWKLDGERARFQAQRDERKVLQAEFDRRFAAAKRIAEIALNPRAQLIAVQKREVEALESRIEGPDGTAEDRTRLAQTRNNLNALEQQALAPTPAPAPPSDSLALALTHVLEGCFVGGATGMGIAQHPAGFVPGCVVGALGGLYGSDHLALRLLEEAGAGALSGAVVRAGGAIVQRVIAAAREGAWTVGGAAPRAAAVEIPLVEANVAAPVEPLVHATAEQRAAWAATAQRLEPVMARAPVQRVADEGFHLYPYSHNVYAVRTEMPAPPPVPLTEAQIAAGQRPVALERGIFRNEYRPETWTFRENFRNARDSSYHANDVAAHQYRQVSMARGFYGRLPSRIVRQSVVNPTTIRLTEGLSGERLMNVFLRETPNGKSTQRILDDFGLEATSVQRFDTHRTSLGMNMPDFVVNVRPKRNP